MRNAKNLLSAACLVAAAAVSQNAHAQQDGCVAPIVNPVGILCCGAPTASFPDRGTIAAYRIWEYCCGHPTIITETNGGECLEAKLKAPGALDRLRDAAPSGPMLIASCTGQLIPFPQAGSEWAPEAAMKRLDSAPVLRAARKTSTGGS